MGKWLKHCASAAALILIIVLGVIHYPRPPGISVGKSLPQGKVKPQFAFNISGAVALLAPDGSLWAWGGTEDWPLFLFPQSTNFPIPRRIGSDSNWTQVALGGDNLSVLKNDGSLWVWNRYGPPTRIGTDTDWRQICTAGRNYLALKEDGSLWGWGMNFFGQLGDGTTKARAVPTMIGADRDWRTITMVGNTSFALKSNGTFWAWGSLYGHECLVPQQLAPGTNWLSISSCEGASTTRSYIIFTLLALKTDGTLWLNSSNVYLAAPHFLPDVTGSFTQIGSDCDWTEVHAGMNSFFARKKDGSWWGCGQNCGQLGLGTNNTVVSSPQCLPFGFEPWAFAPGLGSTHMLGKDGKLWNWGLRLGTGKPNSLRQKFESFVRPTVMRFPSLGFLINSDIRHIGHIDQTPHLLWELPAEVRRSLGTGPKSTTNNLATTQPTDVPPK